MVYTLPGSVVLAEMPSYPSRGYTRMRGMTVIHGSFCPFVTRQHAPGVRDDFLCSLHRTEIRQVDKRPEFPPYHGFLNQMV